MSRKMPPKESYPRYRHVRVQCSHCGKSWSGTENGRVRHEAICKTIRRGGWR